MTSGGLFAGAAYLAERGSARVVDLDSAKVVDAKARRIPWREMPRRWRGRGPCVARGRSRMSDVILLFELPPAVLRKCALHPSCKRTGEVRISLR